MPTPSTEQAVTCDKCKRPLGTLADIREYTMDGKCFARYAYRDPDAAKDCELAALLAQHQDPPASPPAIEGRDLPDKPGIWRNDKRDQIDAFWQYQSDEGPPELVCMVGGSCRFVSTLPKGGWHPAAPAGERDRLAELEAEVAALQSRLAAVGKLVEEWRAEAECWEGCTSVAYITSANELEAVLKENPQ